MENIEIVHGDTERHQFGTGTFGSRSLAVGGQALMMSLDKVVEKAKEIAAHEMGVDSRAGPSSRTERSTWRTSRNVKSRGVTLPSVPIMRQEPAGWPGTRT